MKFKNRWLVARLPLIRYPDRDYTGGDLGSLRRIVAATVFRIIQIVLLPVGIVSYVVFVVKLVAYSRKTGTSATVLASLYTRYMQHKLGTRQDRPRAAT